MRYPQKNFPSQAQTSTELAVFGAILVFILGIMIRYSLGVNYSQSQTLKAMRLAMAESFKSAEAGHSERNTTTVIFIEDRTTADVNKFGSLSRSPFVASASATFSKNLYMPADYQEPHALPVMDMFINGKHFSFTTAGFQQYDLISGTPPSSADGIYKPWQWNRDWDPVCKCRIVYEVVFNFVGANNTWDPDCNGKGGPIDCFDLNRDGSTNIVPAAERPKFMWQWQAVRATTSKIKLDKGQHVLVDVDGDLKEETIIEMTDVGGKRYTARSSSKGNSPIRFVRVVDNQAGDIDSTWSSNPQTNGGKPKPGVLDDIQIYSFTSQGTYLLVQEGKNLPGMTTANQGVVSTQKRNAADIIQRMVRLSNDTGRVCQGLIPNTAENPGVEVCVNNNADCFTPENIYKTCMGRDIFGPILYVRSRIGDLRGRKWITDLGTKGF